MNSFNNYQPKRLFILEERPMVISSVVEKIFEVFKKSSLLPRGDNSLENIYIVLSGTIARKKCNILINLFLHCLQNMCKTQKVLEKVRYFIFPMGYLFFLLCRCQKIILQNNGYRLINNRCHHFHYIKTIHPSFSLRGITADQSASKILINVFLVSRIAWLFSQMKPWKVRHESIPLKKPTYVLPLNLHGWLMVIFSFYMPQENSLTKLCKSTF